jgi:hypothetical protein
MSSCRGERPKAVAGFAELRSAVRLALIDGNAIPPRSDFCNSSAIPFRRQTEAERCFRSKYIDQNERPDLELPNGLDGPSAGKNAIRRLSALNRRIFVDAQHRLDRKGLADNSNITSLEHDDQRERTTAVALRLPKRHCNRAIGSANTAFRDPFVRSERQLTSCRGENDELGGKTKEWE